MLELLHPVRYLEAVIDNIKVTGTPSEKQYRDIEKQVE